MIKLYVLYILLGVYVFCCQSLVWDFFPRDLMSCSTHYSSLSLFSIVPLLLLFRPKIASIVGLLCLIGVAPFAIFWIFNSKYTFVSDQGWIFHLIMYFAIILYFIAIGLSLNIVMNYKKSQHKISLTKPLKITLVSLPLALLLFVIVIYFM
jgi:apolipoprotein N-acyltransferase